MSAEVKRGAAVLTGGAGHLGQAMAKSLASDGMPVVMSDIDPSRLESAIDAIGTSGTRVLGHPADVSDEDSLASLINAAVAEFGGIDVIVNNAGVEGPVAPSETLTLDSVRSVYEVNVIGTLSAIKHALPYLRGDRPGRIINIASGAGLAGAAYMAAYNSSKHAVIGITRSVAREVAKDGIPVNAVCPGCIESPMMGRIERDLAVLQGIEEVSFTSAIPMNRYARVSEIAEVVNFLALDAPEYLTGTALLVDGGLYA